MRDRLITVAAVMMAFGLLPVPVASQSQTAPLTITGDRLPLAQNADGVLKVHVVALADLERLEVSITADRGVTLVKLLPLVTIANMKEGERRDFDVAVRLTAKDFGLVSVAATATSRGETQTRDQAILVGTRPPPPLRVPVGDNEDLADLTLVQLSGASAVVRFGQKSIVVVSVADHLGRNKADIIEISEARMVLDEVFLDPDGSPRRARVTFTPGQKGGTRVLIPLGDKAPPQR